MTGFTLVSGSRVTDPTGALIVECDDQVSALRQSRPTDFVSHRWQWWAGQLPASIDAGPQRRLLDSILPIRR